MRSLRRRTRVVVAFPDGESAVMMVGARLRHLAGTKWGSRRYLHMSRLDNELKELASLAEIGAVVERLRQDSRA